MLHYLVGKLIQKKENHFILEIGGVGLKVFTSMNTLENLPAVIGEVSAKGGPALDCKVFTHLHIKEDAWDVYGFSNKAELDFFEKLLSVNGVGPKTALNILNVDTVDRLMAAINEGRADLLTKASGIGRKTAERVVVELRGKLAQVGSEGIVGVMEADHDIIEALVSLGYTKSQAREAVSKVDSKIIRMEDKIKAALQLLRKF